MSADTPPLLKPLPPEAWNDEILDALGAFPGSLNFVLKQWQEETGDFRGRSILGFLANYPALAKAFLTLNKHVAADTLLNSREKELVILRTTWLRKADNEFAQHIILGKRFGLTNEEIEAVIYGSQQDHWSALDKALLQAVDDLVANDRVSRETMLALKAHYNDQEIMDVIFLVGSYSLLGSAVNSFDIPLDAGLKEHDPLIQIFLGGGRSGRGLGGSWEGLPS